jgi:hypothetical protein
MFLHRIDGMRIMTSSQAYARLLFRVRTIVPTAVSIMLLAASFKASATSIRSFKEKGESGDGGFRFVYE